jgi:hypothetical protein
MKDEIKFFVKNSLIFGGISFAYSMIGLLFVDSADSFIIGNPLVVSGITIEHVLGHIFWGGVIGLATLKIRYIFLGSSFAILIDADHLLQFLDLEMISRMSHSLPFAVICFILFYFVFGKKDLRLAIVAFSAVISHIAFDIFNVAVILPGPAIGAAFPLFSPFSTESIELEGIAWLILMIIGFLLVLVVTLVNKKLDRDGRSQIVKT